jgi:transposase InsO family protein
MHYGKPNKIISDRGVAFTSEWFEAFCNEYEIEHTKVAVATPKANSQVERLNKLGRESLWPGCIKRCQVVVKVNTMSSDLIGGYLTFYLNQPIKWADFRLDALLADTMLTNFYTIGPLRSNGQLIIQYTVLLKERLSVLFIRTRVIVF